MLTSGWAAHLSRGLGALSRHRPAEAVKFLQRALEKCPASRAQDLHRICFYLGIALHRVGYCQSAIKSWTTCQRLNKRGHSRKMLARYTNCYGMERQETAGADDWQAFYSIQAARYLLSKNKHTFATLAEQDMITDLIRDAWTVLSESDALAGMSGSDKISAFRNVHIVFPGSIRADQRTDGPIIAVNFQTKRKVGLSDRCLCGSGLPHILCCGRTPGREELFSGVF
jgi:hypothetical protein